jgi:hypothetical protein
VKLGTKIDVPVFELGNQISPVEIARQGVAKAKEEGYDAVIVDTAGRLQVRLCCRPGGGLVVKGHDDNLGPASFGSVRGREGGVVIEGISGCVTGGGG